MPVCLLRWNHRGYSIIRLGILIVIFAALLCPATVQAKRVALVIGNSAYVNTRSLATPVNDANIIADSARGAGFDDVTVALDLTMSSFQRELLAFREKADGAEVAMIYYAGHGLEAEGENWLLPIDAELVALADLAAESVSLGGLIDSASGATIAMVIVDASRTNQFGKGWAQGSRSVPQGLAEFDANDVLLIYAAGPGQVSTDGSGFNSPFASSLAKRLQQSDLPLQMLGGIVRDDVEALTGGTQRPFASVGITGTPVYLVRATPKEPKPPAVIAAAGPSDPAERSALEPDSPRLSEPEASAPSTAPVERTEAELAYVPPSTAEPDLPILPPTPELPKEGYPDCRESHEVFQMPFDRAEDINQCTVKLDHYYSETLTPFRERMIEHQKAISQLYVDKVGGNMQYSPKSQDGFYAMMMQEHADSDPEGINLADYRAAEARYQKDREYLQDRFCFNTGCGGYPVPEFDVELALARPKLRMDRSAGEMEDGTAVAGEAANSGKATKKKKKTSSKECKGARSGGGLIGGLLGGALGNAAGLGKVGTLIAGGLGGVIGAEIACQLDEKEQEKAAEATLAIVEKEEVGAVATWQSPTRADVSGSSTITALTAEPDGRKCLNITDVAIIDGEETRIAKQMCRGAGEKNYTLMA